MDAPDRHNAQRDSRPDGRTEKRVASLRPSVRSSLRWSLTLNIREFCIHSTVTALLTVTLPLVGSYTRRLRGFRRKFGNTDNSGEFLKDNVTDGEIRQKGHGHGVTRVTPGSVWSKKRTKRHTSSLSANVQSGVVSGARHRILRAVIHLVGDCIQNAGLTAIYPQLRLLSLLTTPPARRHDWVTQSGRPPTTQRHYHTCRCSKRLQRSQNQRQTRLLFRQRLRF